MENLKPCPFCGSDKITIWNSHGKHNNWFYYVKCDICGGQGGTAGTPNNWDKTDENEWNNIYFDKAVNKWNERKIIDR